MSFNNSLNTSFTRSTDGKFSRKIAANRARFSDELAERIGAVQIECRDALKVIEANDTPASFFYVDPPYVGACQGHYDGYSQEDFNALIAVLTTLKGKFLLSSYRNESLSQAVNLYGWYQIEVKMNTNPMASNKSRTKIEVLTANYSLDIEKRICNTALRGKNYCIMCNLITHDAIVRHYLFAGNFMFFLRLFQ